MSLRAAALKNPASRVAPLTILPTFLKKSGQKTFHCHRQFSDKDFGLEVRE